MDKFTKHNARVLAYASILFLGTLVVSCGHPAFAGGDESQNVPHIAPRPRHRPVIVVPVLPPPELKTEVAVPPPPIVVETKEYRVWDCTDEHRVLLGRDDLEKVGPCHQFVPSFGGTGENPSQDDVSPN